jgi:dihydroorotate dehydrogenase electron transfer subunit
VSAWARVAAHDQLGPGLFRLALEAPEIAAAARPGQFVMLRVRHGADPLLARPFSVHGADHEAGLVHILYRLAGRGTKVLSLTRPGKKLLLWGPLGTGFDLSAPELLLVSGGMGAAPLAFAAQKLREAERPARWVHGGEGQADCLGLGRGLAESHRLALHWLEPGALWDEEASHPPPGTPASFLGLPASGSTMDGSFGRPGLVTGVLSEALDHHPGPAPPAVLACGPLAMLRAVAGLCAGRGAACQVSLEAPMACGVGVCLGCALPSAGGGYLRVCREGPVLPAQAVDWGRL